MSSYKVVKMSPLQGSQHDISIAPWFSSPRGTISKVQTNNVEYLHSNLITFSDVIRVYQYEMIIKYWHLTTTFSRFIRYPVR